MHLSVWNYTAKYINTSIESSSHGTQIIRKAYVILRGHTRQCKFKSQAYVDAEYFHLSRANAIKFVAIVTHLGLRYRENPWRYRRRRWDGVYRRLCVLCEDLLAAEARLWMSDYFSSCNCLAIVAERRPYCYRDSFADVEVICRRRFRVSDDVNLLREITRTNIH